MASKNQKQLETAKAKELIQENARKYFTSKVKIPLGNPALKNVHTNQFLWMDLPKEFAVDNWELIAKVLNGSSTRFSGVDYVNTRWYIEGCTIDVDVSGKAEMSLDLNAFASSTSEFTADYRSYKKAYDDVVNKASSTNNGSTKKKTNAVASGNEIGEGLNQANIKKYGIPSQIYKKAEEVCKGKTSDKDKAYALYQWMDSHVDYQFYYGHEKSETSVLTSGGGNCVDNSRLYRLLCLSVGVNCTFVHGFSCCSGSECANHQWNKVHLKSGAVTVDCGRSMASWGSHWGSCSGGEQDAGGSSW